MTEGNFKLAGKLRQAIEGEGDQLTDLHLWRLGPGHLGAIVSVVTKRAREANYYKSRLARFTSLSHLTVEVTHNPRRGDLSKSQIFGWNRSLRNSCRPCENSAAQ